MSNDILDWERALRSMDSNEGHRKTLAHMCQGYLESHLADDFQQRQEVVLLYITLQELF